ncbi:MAG: hypothetical protein ACOYIR_03415 [Christensenellales bacterium]
MMHNEKQSYLDWLEKIKSRAYDCTRPAMPPRPRGMRQEKYDAIRRRIDRLYAPLFSAYMRYVPVFLRCSEEIEKTFETGDMDRRAELMMELSETLESEILFPHAQIEQEERELLDPIHAKALQEEIRKQEKRLGKEQIESILCDAIDPHEDEYLVVFANGTAVGVSEQEAGSPFSFERLMERALERMDSSTIWHSFPKDGDPEVRPGEVKAFYTLNEPENVASFWAVVDGALYAWLKENERTMEEVCGMFHQKDVKEKRVLKVLKPAGESAPRLDPAASDA